MVNANLKQPDLINQLRMQFLEGGKANPPIRILVSPEDKQVLRGYIKKQNKKVWPLGTTEECLRCGGTGVILPDSKSLEFRGVPIEEDANTTTPRFLYEKEMANAMPS